MQCLEKLILYRVLLQAIAIAREDEHQMVSRDDRVLTRPYQHDKKMYMDATSCFANLGRKLLKELLALLLDCMVSELEAVQQCMPCRGLSIELASSFCFCGTMANRSNHNHHLILIRLIVSSSLSPHRHPHRR